MALSHASWWPKASGLDSGERRRVAHDCGDGTTLLVSRDHKGFHAWCFRCNDGGFEAPPAESLADKLLRLARQREGDAALPCGSLPEPAVRDVGEWPEGAKLWLFSAGFSRADIGRLGIYYHEVSDRVVVPCGQSELRFYQARAYQPGRMPKYLGPTPRPAKLLARFGVGLVPTLTEDILSAMKIGKAGHLGMPILGTSLSNAYRVELLRIGECNVWTDPDAAGRSAASKIMRQLNGWGLSVRNIVSERDPKKHTIDEIKEYLSG